MIPIRVLAAGLPPLQEDLVRRTLVAEPDLSLVCAVNSPPALTRMGRADTTDVIVVWDRATELVSVAVGILAMHPLLSMVVLAGGGDTLVEAHVVGSSDGSWPEELIEAVRHAAECAGPR
jgi:hypothetical protein